MVFWISRDYKEHEESVIFRLISSSLEKLISQTKKNLFVNVADYESRYYLVLL